MVNKKRIWLGVLAIVLLLGTAIIGCENGIDQHPNLKYSVQVNNQAAMPRAITSEDTVELYIHNLDYNEDINDVVGRGLVLVASGDRDNGSKGGKINNAGWYSVNAELAVINAVNIGSYSSFLINVSKMKIDGIEYEFPDSVLVDPDSINVDWEGKKTITSGVIFGNPSPLSGFAQNGYVIYPDNFSGITLTDSVVSLKTIITVNPDIIGTPDTDGYDSQGLADDPYKYIKVEGRINE